MICSSCLLADYAVNREEIRRSRRWYIILYNVPTTTSPNLFPVDGVVHRNIGSDFLYIFSSRFWSIKSFKTLSECESRIVGRSPNFAIMPLPNQYGTPFLSMIMFLKRQKGTVKYVSISVWSDMFTWINFLPMFSLFSYLSERPRCNLVRS